MYPLVILGKAGFIPLKNGKYDKKIPSSGAFFFLQIIIPLLQYNLRLNRVGLIIIDLKSNNISMYSNEMSVFEG